MPPVIAPILAFAAANAVNAFIVRVAFSVLLSVVSSKLFGPKVSKATGLSSVSVTTRSALQYRKVVYGQAMVSGPIVYNNLSGGDNEHIWYVVALADHLSDDLVSIWFDVDEIPKADIDWTAGTGASDGTGTGNVTTSRWVGEGSQTAVHLFYYLGDDAQPVSGDLDTAFADVDSNFRLRGVTYLIAQLTYQRNTEKVWRQGLIQNFKAIVKGRRIYDSRLDTTNGGTGAHRYTDSTTWAWSENPALCLADYLVNFMGVAAATAIDWPSFASAADDCEVSAAIPTASTEDRFTCNGVLSLGSTHKDNLDSLLSSMDGKLSYTGGVWTVRASVWEASSVSIVEDDLAGDVVVRGSAPRSDRFNLVRGFFIDPARAYQAAEFQHVTASEFLTRDNSVVLEYDLELPFTNSEFMAQRIAYRNLEQGDNQVIADLTMNARGAKVAIGDVVDLTISELSWSAKTFRCINWGRNADGTYKVTLREDQASSYTDPIEAEYTTTSGGSITLPTVVVAPPTALTATSIDSGIRLSWTNPAGRLFEYIDVYESSSNAWSGATLISSLKADTLDVTYSSGTERWFWVIARNFDGLESLRNPDSDTSTITAIAGVPANDAIVTTEPSDGNIVYSAATQPAIESSGINGTASFTSPANVSTKVLVSWSEQARISNTTSGVAVGEARLRLAVTVNAVNVFDKHLVLEPYTASDDWGTFGGAMPFDVPAGQEIIANVSVSRSFSTSGTSPAQTIFWRDVLVNLFSNRDSV